MTTQNDMRPAIIVLSRGSLALAQRIKAAVPAAEIHGLAARVDDADIAFSETPAHLRKLFQAGRPVIGICAAGILIRGLAPVLTDKVSEPPVIAVAADGSSIVPLLGGHHGANQLARDIAAALQGQAAITTAGDLKLGIALDEPPSGWVIEDIAQAKPVAAALLAGETVNLRIDAGAEAGWLSGAKGIVAIGGKKTILVSDRQDAAADLVYRPKTIVLGIGCERLAPVEEVGELARRCLADAGISPLAVACIATIALKAAEPAIQALARELGVPVRVFSAVELEAQAPRLVNPSEIVFQETGCHGVAEGAALAGVGASGDLISPKQRSNRATCAIARAAGIVDPTSIGRARGSLAIVGIGPGAAASRTHEVDAALRKASDFVGYKLYLDLLGPLTQGKGLHDSDLGAEEARARIALELAAQGKDVALVCSGDAGIYALATLVYELIDKERNPDWERLEITGLPGVSAMQVAAARIGATLGHDFCAISLSDLLTPWPAIEQRLKAAAEGDFVISFYNPVSQRRRTQLAAAKEILLQHRPADTPVLLARNLGRPGETLRVVHLIDLNVDDVDMLTLVQVGSSASRVVQRPDGGVWVYTPRGYEKKMTIRSDGGRKVAGGKA
ncbi:MAG: precorrin-3B C(17)-methyltransferase [Rhodospirillaceae bacterium]|nr:MAG: precorrin-3B C(17)-methyltransferase [Rhodospirillaceae bacterium]